MRAGNPVPSASAEVVLPDGAEGVLIPLDDGYLLCPVASTRARAKVVRALQPFA